MTVYGFTRARTRKQQASRGSPSRNDPQALRRRGNGEVELRATGSASAAGRLTFHPVAGGSEARHIESRYVALARSLPQLKIEKACDLAEVVNRAPAPSLTIRAAMVRRWYCNPKRTRGFRNSEESCLSCDGAWILRRARNDGVAALSSDGIPAVYCIWPSSCKSSLAV